MSTFGGSETNFTVPQLKNDGAQFWTKVDATTGKTTVYRRYPGPFNSAIGESNVEIGTIEPGKKFVPTNNAASGGFDSSLNEDERKAFLSDDVQKFVKGKAEETAKNGCEAASAGNTPEACAERAAQLLNSGKATTQPDADAADVTSAALDDLPMKEVKKTRRTFGEYRYPIDMDPNQDVMKFTMLKYETKDLMTDGTFGFGNRDRVGPEGGARATGTVVLPIQSGIKDQNGADWGDNKMNAFQIAKASVALGLMGDTAEADAVDKIAKAVGGNSEAAKEAIKQAFVAKATNTSGLIQRTKGATINPNLELLFNNPTLRPFTFSFKLSARSRDEAAEIIKIIRFFKQGMAPIRTESNLFLLAPHTFQIHYLLRGTGEHPYIGKMKECALTSMSTDYTPENNYSTLRDGFMTSYTITMEFKELEPIFNDDYEELKYAQQKFATFREDPVENAKLQEEFNKLPEDIGF